jgi:uncharacterized protein (DUF779 family)
MNLALGQSKAKLTRGELNLSSQSGDILPAHLTISRAAAALIRRLREFHGPLVFHLSSGCCDGTAPLCLRQGELHRGSRDVLLGEVVGAPFYIDAAQAALLANADLLLDVVKSESDSYSVEAGDGMRFIVRPR